MKAALVHLIFHEAATVLTKVAQHLAEHPFHDNLLVNASMNIRFRHNPFFLIILQPQLHILAEGRKRKASHLEMLFSPGNADNRDT